jgi:large subunit ribosomal protein L25
MMLTLDIQVRDSKESTETLRARGDVPAVFYGPKEASTAVAISARKLESIWKQAGETTIITLKGAGEDKDTLIKDVQFHPVTGAVLHADFYVLEKGKKIQISIPLEFTGVAPAEKAGHIVVKALHEIEIEVAPQELPHSLPVDMSVLENVGDHVMASQIPLPASAELITDPEEIVVSITAFVEEKEEEAAPVEGAAEGAAPAEGEAAPAAEGETKSE